MGYDFLTKEIHRAGLVAIYKQTPSCPILYLDGEEGEGTHSFINTWNIPPHHLIPVNFNSEVVRNIEVMYKGVVGKVGDINTILSQATDDSFSVVWLDYMCRFHEDVHPDVFREALRVSSHVSVTFSTRGIDREVIANEIMRVMKRHGKMLESITPYKGKSDVENMIKFTITRKGPTDVSGRGSDDDCTSCVTDVTEELVDEPITQAVHIGDRVFVNYRGVVLTANVLDDTTELVLVKFDCDGVERWVRHDTTTPNREDFDLKCLFGVEVGAPLKIFTNGLKGYETTKKTRKCILFRIGKEHRRTRRLTVHAITNDGTIHKKAERWTITPEQAMCWKKKKK
jgi:hypothetical protein